MTGSLRWVILRPNLDLPMYFSGDDSGPDPDDQTGHRGAEQDQTTCCEIRWNDASSRGELNMSMPMPTQDKFYLKSERVSTE